MNDEHVTDDPAQQVAWLRQDSLAYVGLMGAGLIMVQPFLTATAPLDVSAKICVAAWAVAFPLLGALVLLSAQEVFRQRRSGSVLVNLAKTAGQLAAFVGLAASFWHIWWPAGVTMLVAALVAMGVHSAGYARLEGTRWSRPANSEASDGGPVAPYPSAECPPPGDL